MIEYLLKKPDTTASNPYYSSGSPTKLYEKERTWEQEKGLLFSWATQKWLKKHQEKQVHEQEKRKEELKKYNNFVDKVRAQQTKLAPMDASLLYEKACSHYNQNVSFYYTKEKIVKDEASTQSLNTLAFCYLFEKDAQYLVPHTWQGDINILPEYTRQQATEEVWKYKTDTIVKAYPFLKEASKTQISFYENRQMTGMVPEKKGYDNYSSDKSSKTKLSDPLKHRIFTEEDLKKYHDLLRLFSKPQKEEFDGLTHRFNNLSQEEKQLVLWVNMGKIKEEVWGKIFPNGLKEDQLKELLEKAWEKKDVEFLPFCLKTGLLSEIDVASMVSERMGKVVPISRYPSPQSFVNFFNKLIKKLPLKDPDCVFHVAQAMIPPSLDLSCIDLTPLSPKQVDKLIDVAFIHGLGRKNLPPYIPYLAEKFPYSYFQKHVKFNLSPKSFFTNSYIQAYLPHLGTVLNDWSNDKLAFHCKHSLISEEDLLKAFSCDPVLIARFEKILISEQLHPQKQTKDQPKTRRM